MYEFEPDNRPVKRKHDAVAGIPCTPLATLIAALIACMGMITVTLIGLAAPVGKGQEPLGCSFDADVFQGIYVCQGDVDNSEANTGINATDTLQIPTQMIPVPIEQTQTVIAIQQTQVAMTLTAIAQEDTPIPLSPTQSLTPTNTVTASNTLSPTNIQIPTSTYPLTSIATSTNAPSLTPTLALTRSNALATAPRKIDVLGSNKDGVTFECGISGSYRITVQSGAYSPYPDPEAVSSPKWRTLIYIYVDRQIEWRAGVAYSGGSSVPAEPDAKAGIDTDFDSRASAESTNPSSINVDCREGQYLLFVPIDEIQAYQDNTGSVTLSITEP